MGDTETFYNPNTNRTETRETKTGADVAGAVSTAKKQDVSASKVGEFKWTDDAEKQAYEEMVKAGKPKPSDAVALGAWRRELQGNAETIRDKQRAAMKGK